MIGNVDHPVVGPMRQIRFPVNFGGARPELRTAPPTLGQHSREVLAEAGYDEAAIDRLLKRTDERELCQQRIVAEAAPRRDVRFAIGDRDHLFEADAATAAHAIDPDQRLERDCGQPAAPSAPPHGHMR